MMITVDGDDHIAMKWSNACSLLTWKLLASCFVKFLMCCSLFPKKNIFHCSYSRILCFYYIVSLIKFNIFFALHYCFYSLSPSITRTWYTHACVICSVRMYVYWGHFEWEEEIIAEWLISISSKQWREKQPCWIIDGNR